MFYVYILASRRNGALYVGSTDNLPRRMWEQEDMHHGGFTARYGIKTLVWYKAHATQEEASSASGGSRSGTALGSSSCEKLNPGWRDLKGEFF